ncbi:aspartate aminotransferase family protein [Hydromonas duriensis]|uniref:Acetylornithine aminotransferase n=1 Tax=Hydromonas duriensis TaxID=1527608 RepID=A0A4V3DJK9_9BURK|nr:aspartate aminotransferase family protein [Hydromonas duriensis]TDR30502.1 acetylornithine aminotransferase [Hydromonas duriensis]
MSNSSHLMPIFSRLPVSFVKGEGIWLTDVDGKVYFDALSGIAVNGLGHNHPRLVEALTQQVTQLIHVSNLYDVPEQHALANELARVSGMDEVFFSNSGAESNEGAIKLARLYANQQGKTAAKILVMTDAFHGRTMATLTATGNVKVQKGFEPLVDGFVRVPFNDFEAIQAHADDESVVAVMLEVIQGEGGIRVLKEGVLKALRHLCDTKGWLLMIDEVQTGVGRTGQWFAHQHEGVTPDVMTLAKGLGSGVPVGAILTSGRATGVFHKGAHGSTFGGNPLAMAAGLATLSTIEADGLLANAERQGERIKNGLKVALKDEMLSGSVLDIRGRGLMIGIELHRACGELVALALAAGLLINVTHDSVIRLLPPLIISDEQSNELVERLSRLIKTYLQNESI